MRIGEPSFSSWWATAVTLSVRREAIQRRTAMSMRSTVLPKPSMTLTQKARPAPPSQAHRRPLRPSS